MTLENPGHKMTVLVPLRGTTPEPASTTLEFAFSRNSSLLSSSPILHSGSGSLTPVTPFTPSVARRATVSPIPRPVSLSPAPSPSLSDFKLNDPEFSSRWCMRSIALFRNYSVDIVVKWFVLCLYSLFICDTWWAVLVIYYFGVQLCSLFEPPSQRLWSLAPADVCPSPAARPLSLV